MTTTTNTKPAIKIKDDGDGETVSYYYRRKLDREIEEEFCCEDELDYYCNCGYNGDDDY